MYWIDQKNSNWFWIMKDLNPVERLHSEDEAKIRVYELMKKSDEFFNPSKEFSANYFRKLQLLNI